MMNPALRQLRWLFLFCLVCFPAGLFVPGVSAKEDKPLQIYFIDVEGGQSTLIVDPMGESLLVDTGWAGFNGRDAGRILAAAQAAGIQKIDYLAITHYHGDHAGGAPELARRIPINAFVDHGENREDSNATRQAYAAYQGAIGNAKHLVVKPGDRIPLKGMNVEIVAAAGNKITAPLKGSGQANPECASAPPTPVDKGENAYSLGMIVSFGHFRFVDLGDLTGERELACPNNLIGTADLLLATHHGTEGSNPKAVVDAIHPRVVIMNNGARKGGSSGPWQNVHDAPGMADLWQLHYSLAGGKEHNAPDSFIANLGDQDADAGNYIKVTARPDATFTVLNSRNNYEKTYSK